MYWKRGEVVFGRKDTWNMDQTLRPIIAAGLRKFKEVVTDPGNVAGFPGGLKVGGEEYYVQSLGDEEAFQAYLSEWHSILDKMIYAFEAEEPEIPDDIFYVAEGLEIKDQDIIDKCIKEEEEYHRRVQEGLDLFALHYNSLSW